MITEKDTHSIPFKGFSALKAPVQGKWVTVEISVSSRKAIFGGTESWFSRKKKEKEVRFT